VTMLAVGAICWWLYRSQLVEAGESDADELPPGDPAS
jgi:hypothetical protein